MKKYVIYCFALILTFMFHYLSPDIKAQEEETVMDALSLEELLETDIKVASKSNNTLQEAPGIVTLFTKNDIINSGARELSDILELIPGFQFGQDVQNIIGIGLRGNWVHEGKILLRIDGILMNDLIYGNPIIGNRIAVETIERIEVIRGPGSVQYGGFAGLGVINIITSKKNNSAQVSGSVGIMSDGGLRNNVNGILNISTPLLSLTMNGYSVYGVQSDRNLQTSLFNQSDSTFHESIYASKDILTFSSHFLNIGLKSGNFSTRLSGELFQAGTAVDNQKMLTRFPCFSAQASYSINAENLDIIPKLGFIRQFPWETNDSIAIATSRYFSNEIQRFSFSLPVNYTFSSNFLIAAGADFWIDRGLATTSDSTYWFNYEDKRNKEVSFSNAAAFMQGEWKSDFINVTAGARFEHNSAYGSAFVPRVAITKVIDDWHFKALASQAFRAPAIMNIITAERKLKPEVMTAFELEAGHRFSSEVLWTANGFVQQISNPIVFLYSSFIGSYVNRNKTGTMGFETELRWLNKKFNSWVNYSYYCSLNNDVTEYRPLHSDIPTSQHLGFANHSASLYMSYILSPIFTVTPSFKFTSQYSGFDYPAQSSAEQSIKHFDASLIANLCILYTIQDYNMTISLACHNVGNTNRPIVQPYITDAEDSSYSLPAAPLSSREIVARVIYSPQW